MEMLTEIQEEWCAFENAHFHQSNVRQTVGVRDQPLGEGKGVNYQVHF